MARLTQKTEYVVRCRRWVRNSKGEKVWEKIVLKAAGEKQALQFYNEILAGDMGSLEPPVKIVVREITERPYKFTGTESSGNGKVSEGSGEGISGC